MKKQSVVTKVEPSFSGLIDKTIDIKTTRQYITLTHHYSSRRIYSIISEIEFSDVIEDKNSDIDKRYHKELSLTTDRIIENNKIYWTIAVNSLWGIIASKNFGKLDKPLLEYKANEIKRWQAKALTEHEKAIKKIKNLYWENEGIEQDFFD